MANRVLLDVANGLLVSKPGVNVLTAGLSGLSFSSDWSQLSLQVRSSVTLPSNVWSLTYTGTSPRVYTSPDIAYGKTFAQIPYLNCSLKLASESFTRQFVIPSYLEYTRYANVDSNPYSLTVRILPDLDHWNWQLSYPSQPQTQITQFNSAVLTVSVWDIII